MKGHPLHGRAIAMHQPRWIKGPYNIKDMVLRVINFSDLKADEKTTVELRFPKSILPVCPPERQPKSLSALLIIHMDNFTTC